MDKIYIFGRGEYFKSKSQTFEKEYEIAGFLDNAVKDREYDSLYNVPVFHPSLIEEFPKYRIYCTAADFFSMWEQLKQLNIEDDRIRFGTEIAPLQPGLEKMAFSNGETIQATGDKLTYHLGDSSYEVQTMDEFKSVIRNLAKTKDKNVLLVNSLSNKPISRMFGSERGKAVDRYYIEDFLENNAKHIQGVVMEVANNNYTKKYGKGKVEKSIVSHVKGWGRDAIKCNFETGEGVVEKSIDCLICTQTLQYIFDLNSAIKNIYRMLKPGGIALITVPGIKPLCEYDDEQWGEYWSFTLKSVQKLCSIVCSEDCYEVTTYGNVKSATAYLYGMCVEDMEEEELKYVDSQFPFLITAKIRKG